METTNSHSVGAGVSGECVGCGSVGLWVGTSGHGNSWIRPYKEYGLQGRRS